MTKPLFQPHSCSKNKRQKKVASLPDKIYKSGKTSHRVHSPPHPSRSFFKGQTHVLLKIAFLAHVSFVQATRVGVNWIREVSFLAKLQNKLRFRKIVFGKLNFFLTFEIWLSKQNESNPLTRKLDLFVRDKGFCIKKAVGVISIYRWLPQLGRAPKSNPDDPQRRSSSARFEECLERKSCYEGFD